MCRRFARYRSVVVETVFDSIKKSLAQGERVDIRNFGNFIPKKRKARKARNPKTGQVAEVPAKSVPFFKPGKELREVVNS
ncbi:MAG: integration host factor subunit beta [Ketobacter sp.]|nr:integration host factor subunit beta [Ketobacter sp.]